MATNHKFISLLKNEMVTALGCTEPIMLAYAAAMVTKHLGQAPEKITAECSSNIIKNVKSVIVPNSGGMKGIEAACVLGAYFGSPERNLEVLAGITPDQALACKELVSRKICDVSLLDTCSTLHCIITGYAGKNSVSVEICTNHTNIINIIKNGVSIFSKPDEEVLKEIGIVPEEFSVAEIIKFARYEDYSSLIPILDQQIACNLRIAEEGLKTNYGVNVGKTILKTDKETVKNKAKAYAAAGSDARMSGCDLPVVINSGSGNQGLTVSLPVIIYARELGVSADTLYRALILSNLLALYEKIHIGKLSAYCGVVCAASGSAAGITFLKNGNDKQIEDAVTNTLGTLSGMICDGAKASCAAKIAASVDTAITCHEMAMLDNVLSDGDGIIKANLDYTIVAVGRLANRGMRTTDTEILDIMLSR